MPWETDLTDLMGLLSSASGYGAAKGYYSTVYTGFRGKVDPYSNFYYPIALD